MPTKLSVTLETSTLLIYLVYLSLPLVYYRVVSTKLTEEEHSRLLDVCNIIGCPTSTLIRDAILKIINVEQKPQEKNSYPMRIFTEELNIKSQQGKKEAPSELARLLGIKEI